MAEGWGRKLLNRDTQVYSAGIETHGLNPFAVQVMAEVGIDISGHASQLIADLPVQSFDLVITVCGHADKHCPVFVGNTKKIHHGFADPPQLAQGENDEERILEIYRRVRDEICEYVKTVETLFIT